MDDTIQKQAPESGENLILQDAQAVIDADRIQRAEACLELLTQACQKTHCQVCAFVIIGGNQVPVPVQIVAQL
ncbi:MAG: hypothetical protein JXR84_04120 [Anaerolineae bacterium]|nr:hypothetical protein [Anaerolineae bacterium]